MSATVGNVVTVAESSARWGFGVLKVAASVAVAFALLVGVVSPAAAESTSRLSFPRHAVPLASAGDSTTADLTSWLYQLQDAGAVKFTAGYIKGGATSGQVLKQLAPVANANGKVATIRLGTNDIRLGVSLTRVLANIEKAASTMRVSRVVLVAVAPNNFTDYGSAHLNRQAQGAKLNASLKALAKRKGWTFVDPSASFRTAAGGFVEGYTVDGVHPTAEGYALEAKAMKAAILKAQSHFSMVTR